MRRPSFQFYPADWTGNSNLRRCNHAEKGVWLDVMCLMHDQAEYGVLRWPLKEIAQAAGCRLADLKSLSAKGVLKGVDAGAQCEAFVYVPRSGRKDGEAVTLVPAQDGPIWFSSRMVKDEYVRTIRGESSRFGEDDGETPKPPKKAAPKPPLGAGSSSSSSSSPSGKEGANAPLSPEGPSTDSAGLVLTSSDPPPKEAPPCPHKRLLAVYRAKLPDLPQPRAELWEGSAGAEALGQRWKFLLTKTREDQTRYATNTEEGLAWFERFFEAVSESDFLMGRSGKWRADLAWLMKRENFIKVVQGNYVNDGAPA